MYFVHNICKMLWEFSTNSAGKTVKRVKLDPYLIPYAKINVVSIQNPNMRTKIIKHLEENIGERLHAIRFVNDFLDMTPNAQAMEVKIDKFNYIII